MKTMNPRRETLPPPQLALWPELRPFSTMGFVLYGGTALALRLGHRESVDFDFFRAGPLDKSGVLGTSVTDGADVIQNSSDTLTLVVTRAGGTVKLSFFGDLVPARILGRVGEPERTDDGVLCVASIDDLFATKVKVVLDRAEAKDYHDVAALLRSGLSLDRALGSAQAIFGPAYQPSESIKALSYFGDGDLETLPLDERKLLTSAAAAIRVIPSVPLSSSALAED
jgi:hypothetical protein